jgi:uncharacterized peroxidase-related enzyme
LVNVPFFKSLVPDAGPPTVYMKYPVAYRAWSEMSEAIMNGPSPLSQGERELIFAYAAGVAGCSNICIAHAEVAYAWGIEHGLVEKLLEDFESAPVSDQLRPLLAFAAKLSVTPGEMAQADADQVFDAGWDEQALHDVIATVGRAAFMQRLVQGFGFVPLSREVAAEHAQRRVRLGYVNLYPAFREPDAGAGDDKTGS